MRFPMAGAGRVEDRTKPGGTRGSGRGTRVMALRIACDLDGTLADMEAALQREAERLFGPGVGLRGV